MRACRPFYLHLSNPLAYIMQRGVARHHCLHRAWLLNVVLRFRQRFGISALRSGLLLLKLSQYALHVRTLELSLSVLLALAW